MIIRGRGCEPAGLQPAGLRFDNSEKVAVDFFQFASRGENGKRQDVIARRQSVGRNIDRDRVLFFSSRRWRTANTFGDALFEFISDPPTFNLRVIFIPGKH